MVDIFYVHKIEVFYYFIFLGILPLINHLFIFYINNILLETLKHLEDFVGKVAIYEDYKDEHNPKAIHHQTTVTLQKYIEIQLEAYWAYGDDEEYIEYYGEPFPTEIYLENYLKKQGKTIKELIANDFDYFKVFLDHYISEILIIKIFFNVNDNVLQSAYIPKIKLFITFTYLFCWLYIFVISFHTLHDLNITLMILELLKEYSKIPEPFSEFYICFIPIK